MSTQALSPSSEQTLTYRDEISPVTLSLPAKACDAHVHVFGPGQVFPYAEGRRWTPVDAPKEKLFALHKRLGIERCVIVQSVIHGLDNRVVSDAIAAGEGNYLGVALVSPETSAEQLAPMYGQGYRAVRFNFSKHLGAGIAAEALPAFTRKLVAAGLHLQVHFDSSMIDELAPILLRSEVPVVIDHMARVDARLGIDQPQVQALCRLLDQPNFHVKISGIDRVDEKLPLATPVYSQGMRLANFLLERFPIQCVWGTDWPHPNHTHIPDDGVLVNALQSIAPRATQLQALIVDNPARLYQFDRKERAW